MGGGGSEIHGCLLKWRSSGRKKSTLSQPKTYSIDQETLDTLMEAGDDFERIHEANAEI